MSTLSYRQFTGTAAENYERYFVPAIATPVSADLLRAADLQRGERVLDVACGTGLVARLADERVAPGGAVTGIDVAPEMIDVARTASPARIEWRVADAAALPFDPGVYDVVLCQMGLMFMEDRGAAVREMCRVLADHGRIAVNTPGPIQPAFEAMEQAIVEHINPEVGGFVRAVFSMHDPDAVATLLREAGFEDVSTTVSSAELRLPPPADFLWQYINLTPLGPFVAQAPEESQAAMERQVVERWQEHVVDGNAMAEQPMVDCRILDRWQWPISAMSSTSSRPPSQRNLHADFATSSMTKMSAS
jgi:ubiquinone/menaquinone biosynthesis C-methylase UbiE